MNVKCEAEMHGTIIREHGMKLSVKYMPTVVALRKAWKSFI